MGIADRCQTMGLALGNRKSDLNMQGYRRSNHPHDRGPSLQQMTQNGLGEKRIATQENQLASAH
jgi:hypothetical protein